MCLFSVFMCWCVYGDMLFCKGVWALGGVVQAFYGTKHTLVQVHGFEYKRVQHFKIISDMNWVLNKSINSTCLAFLHQPFPHDPPSRWMLPSPQRSATCPRCSRTATRTQPISSLSRCRTENVADSPLPQTQTSPHTSPPPVLHSLTPSHVGRRQRRLDNG